MRFSGGVGRGGREENCPKNAVFLGKRHDNKVLKVQILLSRNFVVMARAPSFGGSGDHLALLLLVLKNAVPRDDRDGFDGFGGFSGCGGFGRDGNPPYQGAPKVTELR